MTIKWIGAHPNNFGSRYGNKIDKIILHWIVGTLESCDATFQSPTRLASAHYGVGDNDIHQYVKEEDCAWHAGNLLVNRQSIGIENEGSPTIPISEATYQTLSELVRDISDRYSIPLDREHIKGHREVSDKPTQCPGTLDIDRVIKLAKGENQMTDLDRAIKVLTEFKNGNEEIKNGNMEGAVNAMIGWINDYQKIKGKLNEVENNLKNSLKINADLTAKLSELEDFKLVWQSEITTAKEKVENAEALANANMKLYKNKNDEFNAVKYMTTNWSYLISFAVMKFKGQSNEDYIKEELPKVIKSLNKEA
jgi:N-acetylmuramoyl-L-alanine amidase CwlA